MTALVIAGYFICVAVGYAVAILMITTAEANRIEEKIMNKSLEGEPTFSEYMKTEEENKNLTARIVLLEQQAKLKDEEILVLTSIIDDYREQNTIDPAEVLPVIEKMKKKKVYPYKNFAGNLQKPKAA